MMLLDGPPFRSGNDLHFGHALITYLKNAMIRYYGLEDRPGNDCHGLPIEMLVEKMGISPYNSTKEEFINKCKDTINSFSDSWYKTFDMLGRNFNKDNQYFTMDKSFMESEWWAFKQLYEKGLVYSSYKIVPYSTGCKTPLSNFEADNFKNVNTDTLYVKFILKNQNRFPDKTSIIAWTTTPWTLPMNIALCVNGDLTYNLIQFQNNYYIVGNGPVAKKLFENNVKKPSKETFKVIESFKGSELNGLTYESLYNYYNDSALFKIVVDEFVKSDSQDSFSVSTGIVHLAPGFGEDDLTTCLKNNIVTMENVNQYCPITNEGKYIDIISDYTGKYVFDCNNVIFQDLKAKGLIVRKESIPHSYPFCWRTETPIIYKLEPGIYVKVTDIKEDLVTNYQKTNWTPKKCGNRFYDWIKNARDWCVSRNRVFGNPIPLWTNGQETICIGSIDELVEKAKLNYRPDDLHLHNIEHITIESSTNGEPLKLVPYVFDCWFDSGVVPIAQLHYPFENAHIFDNKEYLCDIVCEGLDQTRGWFYTLLVISTAIFNKPAFKNVVCTGLVLASDGQKFAKRLNNCIPIDTMVNKYSSDALRIYLISSPAARGDSFSFNENELSIIHKMLHQYCNAYNFFEDYLEKFKQTNDIFDNTCCFESKNMMDKWILSRVSSLESQIKDMMDTFNFTKLWDILHTFIEDLTNWYLAFNRRRFKGLTYDTMDQQFALSTLYQAFTQSMKIFEPFMPFLSSKKLYYVDNKQTFPLCEEIENSMSYLQIVYNVVRKLRDESKTCRSIKRPLNSISIIHPNSNVQLMLQNMEIYLKKELNCENIIYPNFLNCVRSLVQANLKNIGIKYKKESGKVKATIDSMSGQDPQIVHQSLKKLYDNITEDDYTIAYALAPYINISEPYYYGKELDFMIIIDTSTNDALDNIYKKRLLIAKLQKMRKAAGLKSATYIKVYHNSPLFYLIEENRMELETQIGCTFYQESILNPTYEEELNILDINYKFSFVY